MFGVVIAPGLVVVSCTVVVVHGMRWWRRWWGTTPISTAFAELEFQPLDAGGQPIVLLI
jgi:hypothetical protein